MINLRTIIRILFYTRRTCTLCYVGMMISLVSVCCVQWTKNDGEHVMDHSDCSIHLARLVVLEKCRPYTTVRCIRFSGCLFRGELHSKDGYFWCPPRSLVHLIDAHHWQFCFRKTSVTLEQRSVASDHIHLWLMIWSTDISSRSNPKCNLYHWTSTSHNAEKLMAEIALVIKWFIFMTSMTNLCQDSEQK